MKLRSKSARDLAVGNFFFMCSVLFLRPVDDAKEDTDVKKVRKDEVFEGTTMRYVLTASRSDEEVGSMYV